MMNRSTRKILEGKRKPSAILLSRAASGQNFWLLILFLALAIAILLSQPGCGWEATEESGDSALQGIVTDLNGRPLQGARVTVAGQEADYLTDAEGRWQIADLKTVASVDSPATASLPGYQAFVGKVHELDRNPAKLPGFEPGDQAQFIHLDTLAEGDILHLPEICVNPTVKVEGSLGGPYDVLLLVDVSESMDREIPGLPGVRAIDLEREALVETVEQFDFDDTRVGVAAFYGSVVILGYLSDDFNETIQAVHQLETHPGGSTNYQLALQTATDLLVTTGRPEAEKTIVLISDGVPTAYGYPETETNADLINQEQEDIDGALEGAFYAMQEDVAVHTIAVGDEASTSKLTTLPAIADISGGLYFTIPDLANLPELADRLKLHKMDRLELMDGFGTIHEIPIQPDGRFRAFIPVAEGRNTFYLSTYQQGHLFAALEVTFTVSIETGIEGAILCDGPCISAIWAIYVEYDSHVSANIDIYQGPQQTFVTSTTVTRENRRIYLSTEGNGQPLVPSLTYKVDWDFDGAYDEETSIHTSCSEVVSVGYYFGPFEVLGYGHGEEREFYEGQQPE